MGFIRQLKKYNFDRFATKELRFYTVSQIALDMVKEVIKDAEQNDLLNSQGFINWMDELNELSVKY